MSKERKEQVEKLEWTRPTVTDFDIAERTRLEGGGALDGFDPGLDGGGGGGVS